MTHVGALRKIFAQRRDVVADVLQRCVAVDRGKRHVGIVFRLDEMDRHGRAGGAAGQHQRAQRQGFQQVIHGLPHDCYRNSHGGCVDLTPLSPQRPAPHYVRSRTGRSALPADNACEEESPCRKDQHYSFLQQETTRFVGQHIVAAEGNTTEIDAAEMVGQPILSLRAWGKHFIIELPTMALRIHFLLFGSYAIDAHKEGRAKRLGFSVEDGGEINFYACSVKEIDPNLDAVYDWTASIMSDTWNPAAALKKLRAATRLAGVRRAARPGYLCRGRQHHQERSPVPDPGPSVIDRGRPVRRQVETVGHRSTYLQF